MLRTLVGLTFIAALLSGCAKSKPATTRPAPVPPAAPAITATDLAGDWLLTLPRNHQRPAKIVAIDATHLSLQGCGTLSGTYLLQPPHLLILTTDERFRPLAWQIDSGNLMRLVRAPTVSAVGSDYTGSTLTRTSGK